MRRMLAAFAAAGWLLARPAPAAEVDGVKVDEQATLADGTQLVLNGAGMRVKFIVDVYVGALYLPAKQADAAAILAAPVANRMWMHFVYEEVAAESLQEAWSDGFDPARRWHLRLPRCVLDVDATIAGSRQRLRPILDTVLLEPRAGRMTLTWRATLSIGAALLRVELVEIGVSELDAREGAA